MSLKSKIRQLIDWVAPLDGLNDRKEQGIIPSAAVGTTVTSGDGTWGSYAQLIATTGSDLAIVGIFAFLLSNADQLYTIAIGLGEAGSEADIITVLANVIGGTDQANQVYIPLPFPVFVPAGSRIAARSSAADSDTCLIKVSTITGIVMPEGVPQV